MWNTIDSCFCLVRVGKFCIISCIVTMLFLVLCSCTSSVSIPPLTQSPAITQPILTPSPTITSLDVAKIDENFRLRTKRKTIITVSWFALPAPGYYYVLVVDTDGRIYTWREALTGRQLSYQGVLTTEELVEVSSMMNEMINFQTSEAKTGSIIINMIFTVESKDYLRSFDELNAPDSLQHLYEIFEIAIQRYNQEHEIKGSIGYMWNPFRK